VAKIPFRPRVDSVPNTNYNRVLQQDVPTSAKPALLADFEKALTRVQENHSQSNPMQHERDTLDKPVGGKPEAATSRAEKTCADKPDVDKIWPGKTSTTSTARSITPSVFDATADVLQKRVDVNNEHTLHSLKPSSGVQPVRSVELQFQPTDDVLINAAAPQEFESHSDTTKRKRSAEQDTDAVTGNLPIPDQVTSNPTVDTSVGSLTGGQSIDLGVFETVETMLRQLDLLDNQDSSSTWHLSLEQNMGAALELFVHADETGAWSIDVKSSGAQNLEGMIEELRDNLLHQNPNIIAVRLATGDRA